MSSPVTPISIANAIVSTENVNLSTGSIRTFDASLPSGQRVIRPNSFNQEAAALYDSILNQLNVFSNPNNVGSGLISYYLQAGATFEEAKQAAAIAIATCVIVANQVDSSVSWRNDFLSMRQGYL
jgi:hypothetical protein